MWQLLCVHEHVEEKEKDTVILYSVLSDYELF